MSIKITDNSKVKKINRNAVYRYFYKRSPQSKQDVAYGLKLSLPTVTQNINELFDMGLLCESGEFESTGGRKAKALELNYGAKYAVGLDVTKSHVGIVIVDLGCNVIRFLRHRLAFENKASYFEQVGQLISSSVAQAGISAEKILGVGIGLPAIVSEDGQTATYGPVIDFSGGHLHQFAGYIDYPCTFCNDANAAGFAERWHRGTMDNMVYISLSNSVGGAILIGGNICYGSNQRAGEVGHITVIPDGPICYCGQKGCLDAVCNARILSNAYSGNLDQFFADLDDNPESLALWEDYLDNLALAINTLRMLMDSSIVVGGHVGSYMDKYIDTLREKVAMRNTFEVDGSYLDVCTFKFEATAVGAALQYIDAFICSI